MINEEIQLEISKALDKIKQRGKSGNIMIVVSDNKIVNIIVKTEKKLNVPIDK